MPSQKDEAYIAEMLLESSFDINNISGCSISDLKEERGGLILLDEPYIFRIALLKILDNESQRYSRALNELLGENNVSYSAGKNSNPKKQIDSLCSYLSGGASCGKPDGEKLYSAALDAAKINRFNFSKQHIINEIFRRLKDKGAVSKSFEEIFKSESKAISSGEYTKIAVFVYESILKRGFDKTYAYNAQEWYSKFVNAKLFDGLRIYSDNIEKFTNKKLTSIIPEKKALSKDTFDFKYIDNINEMLDVLDFLETAGFKSMSKKIYRWIKKNPENYFDAETAVKTIKQNTTRYKDDSIRKSLRALNLIADCKRDILDSAILELLEVYNDPNHPGYRQKPAIAISSEAKIVPRKPRYVKKNVPLEYQKHISEICSKLEPKLDAGPDSKKQDATSDKGNGGNGRSIMDSRLITADIETFYDNKAEDKQHENGDTNPLAGREIVFTVERRTRMGNPVSHCKIDGKNYRIEMHGHYNVGDIVRGKIASVEKNKISIRNSELRNAR